MGRALHSEYAVDPVTKAAHSVGVSAAFMQSLIDLETTTKSERIAAKAAALTGKPARLYLVGAGVRIEQLKEKENTTTPATPALSGYEITRGAGATGEESDVCDIAAGELMQIRREALLLAWRIDVELHRRMKAHA